jgi:hypothetical protein
MPLLKLVRRVRQVAQAVEDLLDTELAVVDPLEEDPFRILQPRELAAIRKRRDDAPAGQGREDISALIGALERQGAKMRAAYDHLHGAVKESRRRETVEAYDVLWSGNEKARRLLWPDAS